MRTHEISNGDDVIDSRDIIRRVKELEGERESFTPENDDIPDDSPVKELDDDDETDGRMTCDTCGRSWDDSISTGLTPVPSGRCPFEHFHGDATWEDENPDEAAELAALKALADEGENSADDWQDGATLIRESYFVEYAQELAEDIGAIDKSAGWPATCIDWEQAADELRQDYSEVDYDGVTYLVR